MPKRASMSLNCMTMVLWKRSSDLPPHSPPPHLPDGGICIFQKLAHPVDPAWTCWGHLMPGHSSVQRCHVLSGVIKRFDRSSAFSEWATRQCAKRPFPLPLFLFFNENLCLLGYVMYRGDVGSARIMRLGQVTYMERRLELSIGKKKWPGIFLGWVKVHFKTSEQ